MWMLLLMNYWWTYRTLWLLHIFWCMFHTAVFWWTCRTLYGWWMIRIDVCPVLLNVVWTINYGENNLFGCLIIIIIKLNVVYYLWRFYMWVWAIISGTKWPRILLGLYGIKNKKTINKWAQNGRAAHGVVGLIWIIIVKISPSYMGQLGQIRFYDNYFRHTTFATSHATSRATSHP
jgi:hypothetical protein